MPAELARAVQEEFPSINYSKVLQEGLRDRLGCRHDRLACVRCGHVELRWDLVGAELRQFLGDVLWADLVSLVDAGGTAEGAARIIKERAVRMCVPGAETLPLPKANRRTREWIRAELRREVREEVRAELEAEVRAEFIGALEGHDVVGHWAALGHALEEQGVWAFSLNDDGLPMYELITHAGLWATVERHADRPPTYDLWHLQGGPWIDESGELTDESPWVHDDGSACEDGSVTAVWEHPSPSELVATTGRLVRGEQVDPTEVLGPWIERRFLEMFGGRRDVASG